MKSYRVFVCETCGKESRCEDDISRCEAQRLGLTVGEKKLYDRLKADVARWGCRAGKCNVPSTRDMLGLVTTRLMAFETEHHLGDFAK